jgi:nucleoside-diphosphate-sugar epimerase
MTQQVHLGSMPALSLIGAIKVAAKNGRLWPRPSAAQIIRIVTDIFLLNLAIILAALVRVAIMLAHPGAADDAFDELVWQVANYAKTAPVATVIAVVVFHLSGFYSYGRAYQTKFKVLVVAQAVTLTYLLLGMLAFLLPSVVSPSRGVLVLAGAISLVLFVASRIWAAAWRNYVVRAEEGEGPRSVSGGGPDRTALVIGGAGYIGSALLPKLLASGYRVRVLDLLLYGTGPIEQLLDDPRVEIIRADFRHVDSLVKAMRGVDQVVHLGGIVGDPACSLDEELTIDVNLTASRLIAEVAKGHGIRHFIFASTCSVYGASDQVLDENSTLNPLSLYAKSKVASEKVLLSMADDTFTPIIVRFATIYGLSGRTRFDLVVNLLAAKAVFEGSIPVFGGSQWRPFLHVDDAAVAVCQLLRMPAGRGAEIYNVGSNKENYTIDQIAEIIKEYLPDAEIIRRNDETDNRNYRVNFSKIEIMVGFKPQWNVAAGTRQVIEAIRTGQVVDYTETRYSNVKLLHDRNGIRLAPPERRWAEDMLHQVDATAGVGVVKGEHLVA